MKDSNFIAAFVLFWDKKFPIVVYSDVTKRVLDKTSRTHFFYLV